MGPGKPGRSWNFIVVFSRTRKSWKKATGTELKHLLWLSMFDEPLMLWENLPFVLKYNLSKKKTTFPRV